MDNSDKLKNLLYLEYQTKLNYFNIIVITIITSFVTIILGSYREWELSLLFSLIILIALTIILIWLYFYGSLKETKKGIIGLKTNI